MSFSYCLLFSKAGHREHSCVSPATQSECGTGGKPGSVQEAGSSGQGLLTGHLLVMGLEGTTRSGNQP